ncbi:CNDP2 [Mytilus edulis]|uniref:CNDP2 n=1 Tax=Mytilus edulis TaxID=6550 RepID=A0A8S3RNF2_MYTED|nr:CNDP2 [Mytilus edulis]
MDTDTKKLFEQIDAKQEKYIKRLADTVAIKSVSAWPETRPEIVKMVKWTQKELETLGATTQLEELGDQVMPDGSKLPLPPVLLATLGTDPKKKTLLVYGHLDVQPAHKDDGWDTEPFVLTEVDGKLYGRGSTDDKGPVLDWINTLEAMQELKQDIPINIKFMLEGMEESGSEGLDDLVFSKKDTFLKDVDYVCISDNYWLGKTKPCITYGLRGICYFFLEVECSTKDLHSGVFGGTVHEAMTDLTAILGSLVDVNGKILIPGIYDTVAPVTDDERKSYGPIDFDLVSVEGAFSGAGAKTVIPRKVIGKFSIRLVPDQLPEEVEKKVKAHIDNVVKKQGSPNKVSLSMGHGGKPWVSDFNDPNYVAGRNAMKTVFGVEPDLNK